jgi:hypothetical protein
MKTSLIKECFLTLTIILLLLLPVYAATELEIIVPDEILIEKGWIEYTSITLRNTGNVDLHKINISIEGNLSKFFEIQKNKTDILYADTNFTFLTKISLLLSTVNGDYTLNVSVKSNELTAKKSFIVRVFETKEDIILYQIEILRNKTKKLEENTTNIEALGKNVTAVRNMINDINLNLNLAENYINEKSDDKALETIRNVRDILNKADYELSIVPPKTSISEFPPFTSMLIQVLILSVFITISIVSFYFIREHKIETKIRLPNIKIREIIIGGKKIKDFENEVSKIRDTQSLLEEEYKQNLISKESYEEVRTKCEERIVEIEGELNKIKGS